MLFSRALPRTRIANRHDWAWLASPTEWGLEVRTGAMPGPWCTASKAWTHQKTGQAFGAAQFGHIRKGQTGDAFHSCSNGEGQRQHRGLSTSDRRQTATPPGKDQPGPPTLPPANAAWPLGLAEPQSGGPLRARFSLCGPGTTDAASPGTTGCVRCMTKRTSSSG
jgi:hypothetical protein